MTVHDFREIIQHQAFPELVKHGEDSHGGVKYDSSNGQNVSSEEYTLVVNLLDAKQKCHQTHLIMLSLFSVDTNPVYPQVTISSTRSLMLSFVALFI